MQISPEQPADTANVETGKKQTGPHTPEGKKKSSQNARTHGITALTTVVTEQDRMKHDAFCQKMIAELAPVGEMETFLATSVAEEAWRLNYTRDRCNNILATGPCDGTDDRSETAATLDYAKTFALLSLYEQRIHRSFQKHYDQLKKVQAERKAQCQADLNKARLLSQLAKLENLSYTPSSDGFVFSNDEIDRFTTMTHRLQLADEANTRYRKRFGLWDLQEKPAGPRVAA